MPVVAYLDSENGPRFVVDVGWWGVSKPLEAVQKYGSLGASRRKIVGCHVVESCEGVTHALDSKEHVAKA